MEKTLRNCRFILERFIRISDLLNLTQHIKSQAIEEFISSKSKDIFYTDIMELENIIRLFKKFFKKFYNKGGHMILPMPSKSSLQTANDMQEYCHFLCYIYMSDKFGDLSELSSLEEIRFNEATKEAVQLFNLEYSIESSEMDCYDYCIHVPKSEVSFADSPKKTAKSKGFIPKRHLKSATKLKLTFKKVWKSSGRDQYISLKKEADRKNSEWLGGISFECS